MNKNQIAQTIIAQLGAGRFALMTGARFFGQENGLVVALPSNFAQHGINRMSITLDPSDTYTLVFSRARGGKVREIKRCSDIYFDQLQPLFTETTGLKTCL